MIPKGTGSATLRFKMTVNMPRDADARVTFKIDGKSDGTSEPVTPVAPETPVKPNVPVKPNTPSEKGDPNDAIIEDDEGNWSGWYE